MLLDAIEEYRDLTLLEWNFREIVHANVASLLQQQLAYWKQRRTVKWVKYGDGNTKIFHANATGRHRINSIATLQRQDDVTLTSHEDKAALLWESYKYRLGKSEFTNMHFDLENLDQAN